MRKVSIIIMTLIILIYGGYAFYACFNYMNQFNMRDLVKEDCESYLSGKNENLSDTRKKFCETTYLKKDGFLSMHYILVLDKFNPTSLIVVLITMISSIVWSCNFFKNKLFCYFQNRIGYKKTILKILKEAYKYIWILPLIMIMIFICEICYAGWDCSLSLVADNIGWENWAIYHPFMFILLYIFNMVLCLSIYTNIALFWSRINKNFITSLIASILTLLTIQLFFEYVIKKTALFNLINFFRFNDRYGLKPLLIFNIICCIISWIAVYFAFKNKEKLYLDIHN